MKANTAVIIFRKDSGWHFIFNSQNAFFGTEIVDNKLIELPNLGKPNPINVFIIDIAKWSQRFFQKLSSKAKIQVTACSKTVFPSLHLEIQKLFYFPKTQQPNPSFLDIPTSFLTKTPYHLCKILLFWHIGLPLSL
jgi:hypothetical protein